MCTLGMYVRGSCVVTELFTSGGSNKHLRDRLLNGWVILSKQWGFSYKGREAVNACTCLTVILKFSDLLV